MRSMVSSGKVLMLLSAVCIGIQALFVKLAVQHTGPAEVAFTRFLFSVLVLQAMVWMNIIQIRVVNRKLVLARGFLGGIGNLLYFYAIALTPLSHAIVLLYTYPIFATIFARFIFGRKLFPSSVLTILLAFAGIVLIVDPSLHSIQSGHLLGLFAGILVGGAICSLRESRQSDSAWTIFYYFNLIGLVLTLPLLHSTTHLPPPESLWPLAGVVVFSMLGQMLMTTAYRDCPVTVGGVLSMMAVVVGSGLGILILNEVATPRFLLGGLVIVLCGIALTWREADKFTPIK